MNWVQKARIQRLVAKLPPRLGYATYYWLQRNFGGLRTTSPISRLEAGVALARYAQQQGHSLQGTACLEVGTGYQLALPLALWLMGASTITTVDLNPYLKPHLVLDDLAYMRRNRPQIEALLAPVANPGFAGRLDQLLKTNRSFDEMLALTHIRYLAPANAAQLPCKPASFDYHVSITTLEHIPGPIITGILQEGQRLLKPDGLFIHDIDCSDHFSHSDPTISVINFLQFNDEAWQHLAGNKYMYHNRLRVDDYRQLFTEAQLRIAAMDVTTSPQAQALLQGGFPLDARFAAKSAEANAATGAWIVAARGD
jgi:SAM-dependent methyltransferase